MMRIPRRLVVALTCAALFASACQPQPAAPPAPPASFTFTGGGFGHGVGMSQYGALGRAQAGHSAAQILGAYFPNTAIEARSIGAIRVHLADAPSSDLVNPAGPILIDTGGGAVQIASAGQTVRVSNSGGVVATQNLSVDPAPIARGATVWFSSPDVQTIAVSSTGRSYRYGRLQTTIAAGNVRFVESDLSMDQYLYGLAEVPTSWPAEALKAQAIAGRSYAAIRLGAPKSSDFDLYSTTVDQVYSGTSVTDSTSYGPAWKSAVDATAGQVMTHGGKIVQAYYSSSNGGHTEQSDYVWASALPYLHAVPDPFDAVAANPNATWERTYSAQDLGAWIAGAGRGDVGVVTGISIGGSIGASGRLDKATITVAGTNGTVSMTGNQLRSAINNRVPAAQQLRSTKFTVVEATPPDTTPPNLQMFVPNPIRYGTQGRICAIVTSDEPTIYALSINIRGVETKSPVAGVGPQNPGVMCFTIPSRLRSTKATAATLTGAGLDGAANYRIIQQRVTVQR